MSDFVLRWRRHWALKQRNDYKKRVGEDIFIDTSPKTVEENRKKSTDSAVRQASVDA